jgi:hypothetical protein
VVLITPAIFEAIGGMQHAAHDRRYGMVAFHQRQTS